MINFCVGLVPESCYSEGVISVVDNNVVTACVSRSNTSVCYPDDYDVAYSLAVAACNSQGLEYDCEC